MAGFSKPYSDERAKIIDEEVTQIISEQYARAKDMLTEYAEGHKELTEVLLSREVIYTEDVEQIFGKRKWVSRTEEILEESRTKKEQEDANNEELPPVFNEENK